MITSCRRSIPAKFRARVASLFVATLLAGAAAVPARAQDAPPPQLPPASPPPTAPRPAPQPVPPPADAVALCNDASFVVAPATPSACGSRGGLKLVLPTYRAQVPADVAPGRVPTPAALQAPPGPSTPPADATMRCKDGTWFSGTPDAAQCASNGGLAVILPPSNPPVPPAPQPPARP
jgi:hypothetical protein